MLSDERGAVKGSFLLEPVDGLSSETLKVLNDAPYKFKWKNHEQIHLFDIHISLQKTSQSFCY